MSDSFFLAPGDPVCINPVAEKLARPDSHIEAIGDSIAENGQLNPIRAARDADGNVEVLAGVSRLTACGRLSIDCEATLVNLKADSAEGFRAAADRWVGHEWEASRKSRALTPAQRALDAARIWREVFEPEAKARKQAGIAADGETGDSRELAARAAGVTAYQVRQADALIGSPAEEYVLSGLIEKLADAAKLSKLKGRQLESAKKLLDAGDAERFIARYRKQSKPKYKTAIGRDASAKDAKAMHVAEVAIRSHVKAAEKLVSFMMSIGDDSPLPLQEIGVTEADRLRASLASSLPHVVCGLCPEDEECRHCHGRGWLTEDECAAVQAEFASSSSLASEPAVAFAQMAG